MAGTQGVSSKIKCNHFSTGTYDYITITNMFTEPWEGGDIFSFYVSRLRNSISQSPVPIQVLTFASISEVTPEGEAIFDGVIDIGQAFFQAQQSAQMDPKETVVKADDSTV